MTVYIDSLFLTNFFMDSFIIFLAMIVRRKRVITVRLFLAALISAVYGVLIFFPELSFLYSAGLKILFSVIPVLISRKITGIRDFFISWFMFWFVSAALGGIIFAISTMTSFGEVMQTMTSNFVLYVNMRPIVLLIGCIIMYIFIEVYRRSCSKAFLCDDIKIKFDVKYMGMTFPLIGIIDTGCELCDPLSGAPVIVAEKSVFGDIPLSGGKIKINTAAGESTLDILLPESYQCESEDVNITWDAVIALSEQRLSETGEYNALINPLAVEKSRCKVFEKCEA